MLKIRPNGEELKLVWIKKSKNLKLLKWTNNFDLSDSLQEESVTGVQSHPCAHCAHSQLHRLACSFPAIISQNWNFIKIGIVGINRYFLQKVCIHKEVNNTEYSVSVSVIRTSKFKCPLCFKSLYWYFFATLRGEIPNIYIESTAWFWSEAYKVTFIERETTPTCQNEEDKARPNG